jgi:putative PIN family toxin of toxin-antitoxin system
MPLLEELADVLHRPRIKDKYELRDDEIEEYLRLIAEQAISVEVSGDLKVCRDPDDNLILETAVVGKANYAVSRDDDIKADKDLITHMKARGVKVLTVSQFLRKLKAGEL